MAQSVQATQERHENSLLKSELEKLQEENRALRELVNKSPRCPGCGAAASTEEQQPRLENAKLKAEVRMRHQVTNSFSPLLRLTLSVCAAMQTDIDTVRRTIQIESLRGTPGNAATNAVTSAGSPACSPQATQIKSRSSVDGGGLLGRDKTRILELAGRALHELATMCSSGEPLWVRSVETGRDVRNYNEYARLFPRGDVPEDLRARWSVEASRETGVVYLDTTRLVNAFVDVVYHHQSSQSLS